MAAPDLPLVSVVMIFWNTERFFDEAVESVLAQTHPAVELLLCDDGSEAVSTSIALQWVAAYPERVRYLEHPGHAHRGMSATRNLGIAAARGELVAFLDADDVWEPGHLSDDVSLLVAHPEAAMVCGQALSWSSWQGSSTPAADVQYPLAWPPGVVVPAPQMLTALLRRRDYRTPTCSLLVRKEALQAVGGAAEEFTGLYEDQVLLAKLYLSYACVISGSRTARYRRHLRSSTTQAMLTGISHHAAPNQSRETFLRWLSRRPQLQTSAATAEIRSLVARALEPYDRPWQRLRWRAQAALRRAVPRRLRSVVRLAAAALPGVAPAPTEGHYIDRFLAENAHLMTGRVLEQPGLAGGDELESGAFDCVVAAESVHPADDLAAAASTWHRVVKPGGTVLATFTGITPLSVARRFGDAFGVDNVEVMAHGDPALVTVRALRPVPPG